MTTLKLSDQVATLNLQPSTTRWNVRPLPELEIACRRLQGSKEPLSGILTTPAEVHFKRQAADAWVADLQNHYLLEARLFGETLDLYWLDDHGMLFDADLDAEGETIGGGGWLERRRRSRLWGETLGDSGQYYEERIPDPITYPELGEKRFPCLEYQEFIRHGVVEFVVYRSLSCWDMGGAK